MKKSIGHSEGCRNPRCRGNCATAHNGNTAKEIVVDQCKNCVVRGDLEECVKTTCSQHKSWFAVEIMKALAKKGCQGIFCVMNNRVCGECPANLENTDKETT